MSWHPERLNVTRNAEGHVLGLNLEGQEPVTVAGWSTVEYVRADLHEGAVKALELIASRYDWDASACPKIAHAALVEMGLRPTANGGQHEPPRPPLTVEETQEWRAHQQQATSQPTQGAVDDHDAAVSLLAELYDSSGAGGDLAERVNSFLAARGR